jgi:hypothetical protein
MNVLTPSGYKDIDLVNIGDDLVAYDTNTGDVIINKLLDKEYISCDMFHDIYDMDGNLVETKEHIFEEAYGTIAYYKINDTWKLAYNQSIWADMRVVHVNELQVGDIIYDDSDNEVVVTSIVKLDDELTQLKLRVSGDHSYIADGIQLHNPSRYWSGARSATSTNWNFTTGGTNWGSASGLSDNATAPASGDDVFFDGVAALGNSSSNMNTNYSLAIVNLTGYTGALTITGALTVSSTFTDTTSHTWVNGGGTITFSGTQTIASGGSTIPIPITFSIGSTTKTLLGDLTNTGLFSIAGNSIVINWTTNEVIHAKGGLTCTFIQSGGTAKISIEGGTWTGSATSGNGVGNNVDLAGNVTFASIVSWVGNGKTLKYVSGTITTTASTFYITAATLAATITLDTNGISFTNVVVHGIASTNVLTFSLTSNLTVLGTFNMFTAAPSIVANPVTFSGSGSFSIANLYYNGLNTVQRDITLTAGQTYTITTSLRTVGTSTTQFQAPCRIISSNGVTRANLTLSAAATCSAIIDFTRINASGGRTINTWNGVVTDCVNINTYTDLKTVAASS